MRSYVALLLLIAVVSGSSIEYSKRALEDEIRNLPGVPQHAFRMFSGYIPVGKEGTRQIFYWFVEAETKPAEAPVTYWSNGGPGCSGFSGLFSEQGPFFSTAGGKSLVRNEYSWNKLSNMLFTEQPAGVGFSKVSGNYTYNDANSAADNYDFIVGFFERFPSLAKQDFFLSSESYGGHYLPTLAVELVKRGGVSNFKGFIVGNPLTFLQYRDYGQYGTFYGHQLLPLPLWKQYESNGCSTKESKECTDIIEEMNKITAGLDPYALDFPVCLTANAIGRNERYALISIIERSHYDPSSIRNYIPEEYNPCTDSYGGMYLNREDVQKAIHALPTKWEECSMSINMNYSLVDVAAPMMPYYKFLVDGKYNLRILIYSGDDDSICSTMGSQQFLWDLGYNVTKQWSSWSVDSQIAGFSVHFDGLKFATIHGAGHMTPSTQPKRTFELFKSYLGNFQDGLIGGQ